MANNRFSETLEKVRNELNSLGPDAEVFTGVTANLWRMIRGLDQLRTVPTKLYEGIDETVRMIDEFINVACDFLFSLRPQSVKVNVITPEERAALIYLKNKMEVFREADMSESEIIKAVLEEIGYILRAKKEWAPWIAKVRLECQNPKCGYVFKEDITDPRRFFEIIAAVRKQLRGRCPSCGAPLKNKSEMVSRQFFAFPKKLFLVRVWCEECGEEIRFKEVDEARLKKRLASIKECPRGHTKIRVDKRAIESPDELSPDERVVWGVPYIPPGVEVKPPNGVERKTYRIFRVVDPKHTIRIPQIVLPEDRRQIIRNLIERMIDNVDNELPLIALAHRLFKELKSIEAILHHDRTRAIRTSPNVILKGSDLLSLLIIGLRIWSSAEFQLYAYVKDIDVRAGYKFFPVLGNFRGSLIKFGRRVLQKWGKKIMLPYDEVKKFLFDVIAGANMIRDLLRAIRSWIPDQQAIIQYKRKQIAEAMRSFLTMMQGGGGGVGQIPPFLPFNVPPPPVSQEKREARKRELLKKLGEAVAKEQEKAKKEGE